jgi:hypothetical protein
MTAISSSLSLDVSGKLVHVVTGKPLPSEKVTVTIPGGKSFSTETKENGEFKIPIRTGNSDAPPSQVNTGLLKSVAANERDAGEPSVFNLFLSNKQ